MLDKMNERLETKGSELKSDIILNCKGDMVYT